MRITSKSQVTIPPDIREKAHLLPGGEVDFEYRRGEVVLKAHGKAKPRIRGTSEVLRGSPEGWGTSDTRDYDKYPVYAGYPHRIAEAVGMFGRDDTLMGRIVEVRPTSPRFVEVPRAPGRH